MDRSALDSLTLLAHEETDWPRVRRTTYIIRQYIHYEYPVPIRDLRQRLMVVPPRQHGDQTRLGWGVDVSCLDLPCPVRRSDFKDRLGNVVIDVEVDDVETSIDFDAWTVVERRADAGPHRLRASAAMATPSLLTAADHALADVAQQLSAAGPGGEALGERICEWVYRTMSYRHDVTSIHTTAARALAVGAGVCQDYAHIALAIARQAGLPGRYVSGHLLGMGGSHAWVEFMVDDPDRPSGWLAIALDPTHGGRAGLNYLTMATGRDYRDVAPLSGRFRGSQPGALSVRKHASLAEVVYRDA